MQHMILKRSIFLLLIFFNILHVVYALDENISRPSELPEMEELNQILYGSNKIEGIVFTIYESDESSLTDIMPRLLYYVSLIKKKFNDLPVAVVSHGDEMLALTTENIDYYPEVHSNLKKVVNHFDVYFHVCGSFARLNDLQIQDFSDYVDVVPFGPSQINDYQSLGYKTIDLEVEY